MAKTKSTRGAGRKSRAEPIPEQPELARRKSANPVTAAELDGLALRVAQATSTLSLLGRHQEGMSSELHNALGLLVLHLDLCAEDLSDLHRRHEAQQETRS